MAEKGKTVIENPSLIVEALEELSKQTGKSLDELKKVAAKQASEMTHDPKAAEIIKKVLES